MHLWLSGKNVLTTIRYFSSFVKLIKTFGFVKHLVDFSRSDKVMFILGCVGGIPVVNAPIL